MKHTNLGPPAERPLSVRPVGGSPISRAYPAGVSGETVQQHSFQAHESIGLRACRATRSAEWIWLCMFVRRAGCRQ